MEALRPSRHPLLLLLAQRQGVSGAGAGGLSTIICSLLGDPSGTLQVLVAALALAAAGEVVRRCR